jgi:heme-degrading monooxygenase HmoA
MKARFVLQVHLKPGQEERFLQIYDAIHRRVGQGVRGHLVHQLCQGADDPLTWAITSEWEDMESCLEWEHSPEHRALTMPLRDCWDEAKAVRYLVRVETTH